MPTRHAKRLLILGWDAADWVIIRQLFQRKAMPNLQRLVQRAAHGDLATLEPKLSPLLWSSIATGKTADKHGILNFVEPDPDSSGIRLSASTTRRTKALWNILTQSGLRTNVVSWYASHPAEPIAGVCVSNLFQQSPPESPNNPWPIPPGAVHPPQQADRIAALRLHPAAVPAQTLLSMLPRMPGRGHGLKEDPRLKTLAQHVAQCTSVHRAAMELLADPDWDCTMVFHETIDTIGHHFMQFRPPRMPHVSTRDHELFRDVMDATYRLHDQMLGEMLRLVGDDTTVILLSDHGFHSDHNRPVTADLSDEQRAKVEASWHRQFGVLVMAGPGIAPGATLAAARILDITPTALTLLGLPVGQDMDGRVLTEAFAAPVRTESLPSWDDHPGDAGMHPPDLRQDPFEARGAIQQLIDLGYMAALPEDDHGRLEMVRRETQFNLGMVLLTTGRPAMAATVFEPLAQECPAEFRYTLPLARAHLECLRPAAAAAVLQSALLHGQNTDAAALLAAAMIAQKRLAEASHLVQQLHREAADRPAFAQALGDLHASLHEWDDAENCYQRAEQHQPASPSSRLGLARVALGRGDFEHAAELSLDALDIDPVMPEAHFLLGTALAWMNDLDHAAQSFRSVVTLRPGHLDAHRFLSAIARHHGRNDEATEHANIVERLIQAQAPSLEQREVAESQCHRGPGEWLNRGPCANHGARP